MNATLFDFDSIMLTVAGLATPANAAMVAMGVGDVLLMTLGVRLVRARRAAGQVAFKPSEKPRSRADRLTYLAALMASAIAAQGMFMWLKDVLDFHPAAAFLACAFVELAMFVSALRARDNMRVAPFTTGPDGKAVWAFALVSGTLSASHAASASEAFGRLTVTLVAGWLWERSLQVERRALTGKTSSIRWAVTPTRLLIRLGLADPTTRDTDEIARERHVEEYVRAIHALSDAEKSGDQKAITKARKRWEKAYARAVEFARVDVDPAAAALVALKVDAVRQRRDLVERIEEAPAPPVIRRPTVVRMRRLVVPAPVADPTESPDSVPVAFDESGRLDASTGPTQSGAESGDSPPVESAPDTRLIPADPDPFEMALALLRTRTDPTEAPDLDPTPRVEPRQLVSPPTVVFAAPPALPDPDPADDDPTGVESADPTRPDRRLTLVPRTDSRPTQRRAQSGGKTTARRSIDDHRETVRRLVARGDLPADAPADVIRNAVNCSAASARTLRDELREVAQ